MAWWFFKVVDEKNLYLKKMNYVPGTASLIDDIDSKLQGDLGLIVEFTSEICGFMSLLDRRL